MKQVRYWQAVHPGLGLWYVFLTVYEDYSVEAEIIPYI